MILKIGLSFPLNGDFFTHQKKVRQKKSDTMSALLPVLQAK
jgi:hypothetical protein